MLMPDYKINEADKCQVLVTVPQCLENILSENSELKNKIKYVILDEIQTINDDDLGRALEKILHFVQCPVLILSATIGNIDAFFNWLKDIHAHKGLPIGKKPIQNKERFCDLKKYIYAPKNEEKLVSMHELYGYSYADLKSARLSEEFYLLPTEIVELLEALEKIALTDEQRLLVKSVQPEKFLTSVILNKNDVKLYQEFLMQKLIGWCHTEAFSSDQIKTLFKLINGHCDEAVESLEIDPLFLSRKWALDNVYEFVQLLHERKMLPAIVFLNSSEMCNELAERLTKTLEKMQSEQKPTSKVDLKKSEKLEKSIKRNRDKEATKDEWKSDTVSDSIEDFDRVDEKFTFLDAKYKISEEEMREEIDMHRHRPNIPKHMFEGWKRGVGVHHAVFNTKFRNSVECLFRKKHLQIVFATETLSLGINMPCKTVVLTSDSVHFNAVKYKQMIGRAGRRSFDTFGNVVYFGVPQNKIKNFISSNIPSIKGRIVKWIKWLECISYSK